LTGNRNRTKSFKIGQTTLKYLLSPGGTEGSMVLISYALIITSILVGLEIKTLKKNLPYGTLGPEGLIEYDFAAVYDIAEIL